MPLPEFVEDLGDGIFAIDTGFHRPRYDAAYLVTSDDGRTTAFIDTGTNHALPRHLAALQALGLPRDAVEFVIPTHVHLDHAGGAGALMRELPAATLVIHPRGAKHMIDPTALYEGARAVYGDEEMARTYGAIVPVDASRVRVTHDGMDLALGTRTLNFIDTPGHALHHHCVWDERTRGWFTGDTFGVSYRDFDRADGTPWILPTTPPSQFEPVTLRASVERLLARAPRSIYLTHYGRVSNVQQPAQTLLAMIDETAAIGRAHAHMPDGPQRHDALKRALGDAMAARLRAHGHAPTRERMAMLAIDVELNAQGVGVWLDRAQRARA
jgi:glyoxylase-like metal-dependent hydrolase (beta-lactamase superfamily II)